VLCPRNRPAGWTEFVANTWRWGTPTACSKCDSFERNSWSYYRSLLCLSINQSLCLSICSREFLCLIETVSELQPLADRRRYCRACNAGITVLAVGLAIEVVRYWMTSLGRGSSRIKCQTRCPILRHILKAAIPADEQPQSVASYGCKKIHCQN
jgi:hypothetical protein